MTKSDDRQALVPVQDQPFNAETPLSALASPVTPTELFYVRNHFPVPELDVRTWRLVVDGEVEHPLELSLADLHDEKPETERITLECAGNGRSSLDPKVPGTPWNWGAIGTADFTGVALSRLLDRARPKPGARELVFRGADHGTLGEAPDVTYERSLSMDQAREARALLAWEMNGEPLTANHGFPLRLVVPRWYGMASVKWLTRISVLSNGFEGEFQTNDYYYRDEVGSPEDTPVTWARVRSLVTDPPENAVLEGEELTVRGIAWSGSGRIKGVEVSLDDGRTWKAAKVEPAESDRAHCRWQWTGRPENPGSHRIVARATDEAGCTQPLAPRWNQRGYGINAVMGSRVQWHPRETGKPKPET